MYENQTGLDSIRVKRETLLEVLKSNRDSHRATFEEAMEGYRRKSIEILEDHIKRIKDDAPEKIVVSLPIPDDHTDEYDRVIEMIEWSIDDEFWLSGHEFDQFVRDNWGWKAAFLATASAYSG